MITGAAAGDIAEALCGQVLTASGVPHMRLKADGWPLWASASHVSLNSGRMSRLKLYGDLLIPAAPHNVLISVKTEAARERLVVSGNRLESVAFGFFTDPNEFWSETRPNLYRRWGFSAIYMPNLTLREVGDHIRRSGRPQPTNINGRPLYRPLAEFGPDMLRIAGRVSFDL